MGKTILPQRIQRPKRQSIWSYTGFLEKASKKLESDKVLAKVTAPPSNSRKRNQPEDPTDLYPMAPQPSMAVRDYSTIQTPTTEVPQVKPVKQKTKTELVPAGRIQFCLPPWEQITLDPWVLEVVKGHQLKLVQIPSQTIPVTSDHSTGYGSLE